jgi:hypothetical protein
VENIEIHNINFNHGEGVTAKNRNEASELQSQVQGHLHNSYIAEYTVGANLYSIWYAGCGIDIKLMQW